MERENHSGPDGKRESKKWDKCGQFHRHFSLFSIFFLSLLSMVGSLFLSDTFQFSAFIPLLYNVQLIEISILCCFRMS